MPNFPVMMILEYLGAPESADKAVREAEQELSRYLKEKTRLWTSKGRWTVTVFKNDCATVLGLLEKLGFRQVG